MQSSKNGSTASNPQSPQLCSCHWAATGDLVCGVRKGVAENGPYPRLQKKHDLLFPRTAASSASASKPEHQQHKNADVDKFAYALHPMFDEDDVAGFDGSGTSKFAPTSKEDGLLMTNAVPFDKRVLQEMHHQDDQSGCSFCGGAKKPNGSGVGDEPEDVENQEEPAE